MREERFADASCKVATYTLDHLAYTLQPPVVAAIVDYAGGGRLSCELTDVDPQGRGDRQRARDDVPPPVHGPGRAQLFLEGAPEALDSRPEERAKETRWRAEESRIESRSWAWAARRSVNTGTRAPTTCSSTQRARPTSPRASVPNSVDAYWLGTMGSGVSGLMLSEALKLDYKPVTRLENMCATGSRSDAQRGIRGGERRVRPRDGDRRREAQGLGLLGPHRHRARRPTAPTRP